MQKACGRVCSGHKGARVAGVKEAEGNSGWKIGGQRIGARVSQIIQGLETRRQITGGF